mmetsp:Transcript_19522/g.39150  ORF Transcript_19522/g.39150 Transcript_19522/m.39150 type:complete len:90 (+) Transcript_19522:1772-2041(+)
MLTLLALLIHPDIPDSIEARIRWKEDTKTPPNRYADGAAKVTRSGEYEDEAEKSSNDQRRLRPRPHLLYKCVARQTPQEGTGEIQSYTS